MSKYDHVLFIAPSESMNERSTMKFISATRNTFKRNRIYPVYLLVETGYADAFNDFGLSVLRTAERTLLRSSPYFKDLVTVSAQRFGTKLWSSYRTAVSRSFANATGPYKALAELVENSVRADLKTHFIGESAGSLVIANALEALDRAGMAVVPETTHLVAPLLTPPQHRIHFLERLANVGYKGKRKSRLALKSLYEIACAPTPTVVSGQGQELAFSWSAFASGLESPGGRAMHDHAVASLQPRLDGRNLFKSHLPNDQIMMNADTLNSIVSRIIGAQQPIYEWEPRDFW